jgi:hypothetical protein
LDAPRRQRPPGRCVARILVRRPEGIFVNPFERGQIGPDLFRAACDMGLEGGGNGTGFRAQLLFFLDDLIPSVFGTPLTTDKPARSQIAW